MDRPAQQPPEPPDAAESPLSFPVEAPRPAGPEPGAGAPSGFAAETPRPADEPGFAEPQAEPLPYPVALIPGTAGQPPQAAAEPSPPPAQPPRPSSALGLVPPALTVVAALMVLAGSFLPLFRIVQSIGARQRILNLEMTVYETAWGSTYEIPEQESVDQPGAPVGIPLLFAVVVLLAAAVVTFWRPSGVLGRWLIGAGAVFAAGVVVTIGMSGAGWSAMAGRNELDVSVAPGMWLLIAGTVAAAAAAVLAQLTVRGRATGDWADPAVAYADTPTPPSGVAVTVLPPEPEDDQRAR